MRFVLTNVRAVVANRLVDEATIDVDDGAIVAVREGTHTAPGAIDGHRLLAVPGLVDTHSDGLEKEANPRRTSTFPLPYALVSFEARVRSAGITTIAHGVAYQDKARIGRSVDAGRHMYDVIDDRRAAPAPSVDHHVLYRVEARDETAVGPLVDDLAAGRTAGAARPLVSFEDHTPGQGQYRDRTQYERSVDPSQLAPGQTAADYVDALIAEAERHADQRERNLELLSPLAKSGEIALLAHDPEDADDIARRVASGATIAEFPVARKAAEAARDHGMPVVMGAPNALRGGSHSGNVSAQELVAAGLCQVLASDYMPSAMLASAFVMAAEGIVSLPEAIGLITSGPADMLGLPDRGRLAEGARADLVLVDDRGPWPQVVHSWAAADQWGMSSPEAAAPARRERATV